MPKPVSERQRAHYRKMLAAGFRKVCVYVPADKVKALREYAAKMRKRKDG